MCPLFMVLPHANPVDSWEEAAETPFQKCAFSSPWQHWAHLQHPCCVLWLSALPDSGPHFLDMCCPTLSADTTHSGTLLAASASGLTEVPHLCMPQSVKPLSQSLNHVTWFPFQCPMTQFTFLASAFCDYLHQLYIAYAWSLENLTLSVIFFWHFFLFLYFFGCEPSL